MRIVIGEFATARRADRHIEMGGCTGVGYIVAHQHRS